MRRERIRIAALFAAAMLSAPGVAMGAPLPFRTLLIIKRRTALPAHAGLPAIDDTLDENEIARIKTSFSAYFPKWIAALSHGKLKLQADVVVDDAPLDQAEKYGKTTQLSVTPGDVSESLRKYVGQGAYDSVFFFVSLRDKSSGHFYSCCGGTTGGGFSSQTGQAGFSVAYKTGHDDWSFNGAYGTETFLHEWLHQAEEFYGRRGVPIPHCADGSLHCARKFGYGEDCPHHWKRWYEAYLNAALPGGYGLGPTAWRLGNFRGAASRPRPVYSGTCTPEKFQRIGDLLAPLVLVQLRLTKSRYGREAAEILGARRDHWLSIACPESERAAFSFCEPIPDTNVTSFNRETKVIALNHRVLHGPGRTEDTLLKEPVGLIPLAQALSASFVHEASHARREAASAPVIEDELVAEYRQTLYLLDRLEEEPAYAGLRAAADNGRQVGNDAMLGRVRSYDAGLVRDLLRSEEAFESAVRHAYPNLPSVFDETGSQRRRFLALHGKFGRIVAGAEARLAKRETGADEARGLAARRDDYRAAMREAEKSLAFLKDEQAVAKARKLYAGTLNALRRDAQGRRLDAASRERAWRRLSGTPAETPSSPPP